MQYFYRAHCKPETVLDFAAGYFDRCGFGRAGGDGDHARYSDARGPIDVQVEIEGGHYTRVTVSTSDVGESELDKVAKRFLTELHRVEDPKHVARGAY